MLSPCRWPIEICKPPTTTPPTHAHAHTSPHPTIECATRRSQAVVSSSWLVPLPGGALIPDVVAIHAKNIADTWRWLRGCFVQLYNVISQAGGDLERAVGNRSNRANLCICAATCSEHPGDAHYWRSPRRYQAGKITHALLGNIGIQSPS